METPLTANIRPDGAYVDIRDYQKAGGYRGMRAALAMAPREVQEVVKRSNLRGRGGAGFPTGMKWSFVPMGEGAPRPKYLVVNADEKEPGAMKDRLLLEGDAHQIVEGAAIAAYAIEAEVAYIFLRKEYRLAAERLERAIAEARAGGLLGEGVAGSSYSLEMHVHMSAGRYMCGEESALLNSLEGGRAIPRSKPPFPQVSGLWGMPTIVNNAETVCNLPHILSKGWEWYRTLSSSADSGTKIYGVSGRVRAPGLWELPMGTPLRELIFGKAGGMREGLRFRGVLPGGGSTRILTEASLEVAMDFDSVAKAGSRLGTGTLIVMDDGTCPVGMLLSLERFFARESCGWCTPCREGLPWVVRTLEALERGAGEPQDIAVLERHARLLGPGGTLCLLAPGAMEPLASALSHFRDDFERHVKEKRCPWK